MNTAMPGIVSYSLHAAILTAAFYIFWRLLLGKETLHRLNRVVLVLTPLVSLILPLCVITIHRIEYVDLTGEVAATGHQEQASAWHSVILAAYMIGAVLVVLKTVYSAARIWRIVRKGEKQVLEDGSLMVVTEKDVPPFSWMRYIILSRKDFEAGNPELLFHEQAHVHMRHSLDILLVDVLTAFQWYNPIAWMLREDLRGIHEYEADEAVLKKGIDATQYQLFLIRKAAADRGYTVANSLQSGTIRNRIAMMLKKRTQRALAFKALYIIPIIGVSLAASARTVTEYLPKNTQKTESVPFQLVEEKPTFNGSQANEFSKWVNSQLVYPEAAKEQQLQGRITLRFTISEDGDMTDVKVLRSKSASGDMTADPSLEKEAVRVVSSSPKWAPGKHRGKTVPVTYTFPVIFQLK